MPNTLVTAARGEAEPRQVPDVVEHQHDHDERGQERQQRDEDRLRITVGSEPPQGDAELAGWCSTPR